MINQPQIIAHRGASFEAPENTMPSAHLAWQENADALECDIHQTLDGELVVIHDADTLRTTGTKKIINECTFDELQLLDAGSWKDKKYAKSKIPSLRELVETVPPNKRIIIEIKSGFSCLPALEEILEQSHLKPNQITLLEFDEKTVFEAKKHFPNLEVLFLYEFFGEYIVTPHFVVSGCRDEIAFFGNNL